MACMMTYSVLAAKEDWEKKETIKHNQELQQAHRISEQASDKEDKIIKANRIVKTLA